MVLWNVLDGLILFLLAVCLVLWPTQLISDSTNRWLRIAAIALVALQILLDGPRAQLVPAYLVAALFAVLLIADRTGQKEPSRIRESKAGIFKKLVRWTLMLGTAVVLLLSVLFCLLFPRFEYPVPDGKYAIATRMIRLTDDSRPESYTEAPDDHREISVRITYPAEAVKDLRQDTAHSDAAGILALLLQSSSTLDWGAAPTHAKVDAPVATARAKYPVLIFSHGFPTGYPEQNTVLVEHLASHGYIVMAINHAWQSLYYEFADGTVTNLYVLTKLENSMGPPQTEAQLRQENALWARVSDAKDASLETQAALIGKAAATNPRGQKFNSMTHRLISDDQRFLMNSLVALQRSEPLLAGHLDVDRVGVFGQSAGGTASQITCVVDRRCRAGVNMDGFQPLLLELSSLETPFMYLSSKDSLYRTISHERSNAASYFVYIKGASHLDFTDAMLSMSFLKNAGLFGAIDTQRMYDITNRYVLAFFNKHLLGENEPLLDGASSGYEEVLLSSKTDGVESSQE